MDSAEKVLDTELERGKEEMQGMISSRGTGKTWSAYWQKRTGREGSFPGRVQSGDMRNSVEGRVTSRTDYEIEGVLGWAPGTPDYFAYQEEGFRHTLSGGMVPGMFALRDAGEQTKARVIAALRAMAVE